MAGVLLIKNWKPVGGFFKNLFSGVIGWVKKAFAWVNKLLKPLKKVASVVGKGFKSVSKVFSSDEPQQSKVGDAIKDIESDSFSSQKLFETNNISNLAQEDLSNNSNSNISISAPITINAGNGSNEKEIAHQVRIAIEEVMHKFTTRKQSLSYD